MSGSNLKFGRQAYKGKGFGEVMDQCPKEDAKCVQFTETEDPGFILE